jgi:hypothetical protein
MIRPGLKKLLEDIAAGKIDTVVVYKVDRLTRSLADFAKIVETFDSKGVSFVSVTQQFNTTTSMGRLTLNVLLSFAQFEREVTGERIRDKVACLAAIVVAVTSTVYALGLHTLLTPLLSWPLSTRIAIAFTVILPFAAMGIPFPLVLRQLGQSRAELLPWAWAINGCASVVAGPLATLLALGAGLPIVLLVASACYSMAALLAGAWQKGFVQDSADIKAVVPRSSNKALPWQGQLLVPVLTSNFLLIDHALSARTLNALSYDILASEEVITLLVERRMRFFSIRGGRFKPRSIFCDLFAGPKNLGFQDASRGPSRNSAYIDKVSSA